MFVYWFVLSSLGSSPKTNEAWSATVPVVRTGAWTTWVLIKSIYRSREKVEHIGKGCLCSGGNNYSSRLHYCLRELHIFTGRANLTYIFYPYGNNQGVNRHLANKLMRWALLLATYRYVIEFLPGYKNVWADILTWWGSNPSRELHALQFLRCMLLSRWERLNWIGS